MRGGGAWLACLEELWVVKLSSLLTVKTLTGMTTDVYPRENCIAPAIVFIVWTTDTKNGCELAPDCAPISSRRSW